MPRCARIRIAGVPLHIIQRGNNRQPCFLADGDYRFYLAHLDELAGRFDCAVHAYVLMSNHVHMLISPAALAGVSFLMKHLSQRYVQYVNRSYDRTGTLWEGRFRSHPVQDFRYLLACYRYIELNPVRACMVSHPGDYPWSSYRANAGLAHSHLITPHEEYLAVGVDEYRRTFPTQSPQTELEEIRAAAMSSLALGNEIFRAGIAQAVGRRMERGKVGRPPTRPK